MSVDLSDLFEQKLSSMKYNEKEAISSKLSSSSSESLGSLLSSLSTKGLPSRKNCKQFKDLSLRAKNLIETIGDTKKFLLERRRDYLNMFSSLSNQASSMSDVERDQIDQDMVASMKDCQSKIELLKHEIRKKGNKLSVQRRDTMAAIIESIETYLKVVCDLFADLRAFRIRRISDKQKLSRLDRDIFQKEPYPVDYFQNHESHYKNVHNESLDDSDEPLIRSRRNLMSSFSSNNDDDVEANLNTQNELTGLTKEELQIFEEENARLFEDINLLEAETKQIEGNVYEIAQLHKTFQQNFLQQDEEIQRVHGTAVETSSNIQVGNEELRSAIKNKGQLRIWILFFNIILSLTLFFLDWYNP